MPRGKESKRRRRDKRSDVPTCANGCGRVVSQVGQVCGTCASKKK